MPPRQLTISLFVAGAACCAPPQYVACGAAPVGSTKLFHSADIVPADVTTYVHVEHAAAIRDSLGRRLLGTWALDRLVAGDVKTAVDRLARGTSLPPERLFDLTLGRSFTLVIRESPAAPHATVDRGARGLRDPQPGGPRIGEVPSWAIVSEIPAGSPVLVALDRLPSRVHGPVGDLAVRELPEHDLILAAGRGLLLIGPRNHHELFDEVVRGVNEAPQHSLGSDPALDAARKLDTARGQGAVGVVIRHSAPPDGVGGWSAIAACIDGDRISVTHVAQFDESPFTTPVTKHGVDLAPLEAMREHMLLAIIEPTDVGSGSLETFLELKFPLVTPELRANLGPRRMLVMSQREGRMQSPPVDLLCPTMARIYEVRDPIAAPGQLDRAVMGLASRLQRAESPLTEEADVAGLPWTGQQPRRLAIRSLLGDAGGPQPPLLKDASLNWACASEAGGSAHWVIASSDPDLLNDVRRALTTARSPRRAAVATCANGGFIQGRRLAQHIRTWANQAGLLVDQHDVSGTQLALRSVAGLADGIDSADWLLERPTVSSMKLEATIMLAPLQTSPAPARREALK